MIPRAVTAAAMPPAERKKSDFELSLETPQAAQTWGGAPRPAEDPYSRPVAAEMRPAAAPAGPDPLAGIWMPGQASPHSQVPTGGSLAALADKAMAQPTGTPEEIAYQTHIADLQKRGDMPVRAIGTPTKGFQQQSVGDWRAALAQRDPKLYNKAFGQPSAPSSAKSPSSKADPALLEFLKRLAGGSGG